MMLTVYSWYYIVFRNVCRHINGTVTYVQALDIRQIINTMVIY